MGVPQVVIVGRPNVGKSSIFNWLARKRLAIVDNTAGVTRDRQTFLMCHRDQYFDLVDTGGIGFDDPDIQKKYPYAKSAQASFEALKPRPVTPFYPQMSSDAIQPAFGQAMAKQIPPEQAIKQMAEKMRSIMKKG